MRSVSYSAPPQRSVCLGQSIRRAALVGVTLDREELADQNQDASCHRSSDFKNFPITVSRFDVVFPEPAS